MNNHVTLEEFVAVVTGDSVQDVVRESRCVALPFGCGENLMEVVYTSEDGDPEEDALYWLIWQMTGLCGDCQDEYEELEDEAVDAVTQAVDKFELRLEMEASVMRLLSELERDDDSD
ncbi:hypothetical protein [Streptomyces sp. NPDC047981]|uniref:hypothetical protein n=1 Tax=Streptomyces sp. NPDC047981 TaxID=3154610 RepID=UPI00343A6FB1